MRDKRINKGSAIIEMTLLIPVFLGCVYFFIMLFLFLINSGEKMEILCQELYSVDGTEKHMESDRIENGEIKKEGTTIKAYYKEQGKWFDYNIILQRDGNNPAKNIRRWQLAADQF